MFDKKNLIIIEKTLISNLDKLSKTNVLTGFDGYVDKLVRLKKNQGNTGQYYLTINEFIEHIERHGCESSDIEMECMLEKVGGNGTLLAEAISAKGVNTTCIGAMGFPKLHPKYQHLSECCNLISVEEPASSLAMEFENGKLMFGDAGPLNRIDWDLIENYIGIKRLIQLFEQTDLWGFANWSGLLHSNEILSGIITKVCPNLTKREKFVFFDLADPSAKSDKQFLKLFQNIEQLKQYFWVILGLNPKESLIVYNRFFNKHEVSLTIGMENEMRLKLPVDELVIHGLDYADTGTKSIAMQKTAGEYVKSPKIVTGGGDNFNSGYCIGKLIGLSPQLCGVLGNLSSMIFVGTGYPAEIKSILEFIHNYIN